MKNDSQYAKRFSTLFRKIKAKHKTHPPTAPEPLDPVGQLVMGFLQWNATSKKAESAYGKLIEAMVDLNELRVSHCHQVAEVLGERYPMVQERCMRLRESLQDVFHREHAVNLDRLGGLSKKEVRAYLDTLGGMTPYVAAHVTLVSFGGHAIPVDETLKDLLASHEVVDPKATPEQIESFLLKQIKASDAPNAHAVLRAWADSPGASKAGHTKTTQATKTTKTSSKKRGTPKATASKGSTGTRKKKSA